MSSTPRPQGLDWVKRTRVPPLKAITINQHLDRAHAIFEWATAASPPLATHNPVARLVKRGNKLKVERFEPAVVDAETIEALIAAAAPQFRLEFTLMGHLAMRWGEALGVGVGHIKDGQVLVRQQVIEDRTTKPHTTTISSYGGKMACVLPQTPALDVCRNALPGDREDVSRKRLLRWFLGRARR